MAERKSLFQSSRLLLAAVLASVLASACCLGPFLLLATGLSGAWMSRLMLLEPIQPFLAAVSLLFIVAAGWRLISRRSCVTDSGAATVARPSGAEFIGLLVALVTVLILISSEFWIPVVAA